MDMRSLLLLSVFLALIREGEGQKLTVSLLPKFPQVYVGDDVTLICNRNGGSKPTTWYISGTQQSHQDYLMVLTAVTPENKGPYVCEQGGSKSDPYTLTVLELEPDAQLSPSTGGAVMTKGEGRNLVLQVDDDLKDWACFVLREVNTFSLGLDVDEKMNRRAVIFAELKEAERATFWCKKKKQHLRTNTVMLKKTELMVMLEPPAVPALQGEPVALRCVVWGGPKLENAIFFKDKTVIMNSSKDTYKITNATQSDNGKYSCHASYRFSHISAEAAKKEGDSDDQELKVIGGPPAAVISESAKSVLQCSCPQCPASCTIHLWYHAHFNDPYTRRKLTESEQSITVEVDGEYSCRMNCGNGFSRFSKVHSYNAQSEPDTPNLIPIMVAVILIFLGLFVVLLVALKRRRGGSSIQETKQDKDKTGGDYEQIQLKDKDQAVYHTLAESTNKDQAEGGYEPLQKKQEEGVYHTLGPGEGQSESQGGYEALKSVKAEVYQTLSSDDSKKPAGEAEGGYEQLPQKDKDYEAVTLEENPYEEVKKQMGKEKE